jgi:cell division protein FtsZ
VAIITKPFSFEGARRKRSADAGIQDLKDNVDTLITIPNDRLLQMIDRKTSLVNAFGIVDEVLQQGVQGISSLITIHGLINLDFADVKAIMSNAGSALMGIGRAKGDSRAVDAARMAIDSPLLETSVEGAQGVLFNITGGRNMTMHEIDEAAKTITEAVSPDANIIFGAVLDEAMEDDIQITVVATGFDAGSQHHERQLHHAAPVAQPEREREIYRPAMPEPAPVQYHAPEPEPEPEPEPVYEPPAVLPLSRRPLIDERPQLAPEPEPEVVPVEPEPEIQAPPRRFPSLSSIEPDDNEDAVVVEDPELRHHAPRRHEPKHEDAMPAYEETTPEPVRHEPAAKRPSQPLADLGIDDDDLDVPAFIRRKVD